MDSHAVQIRSFLFRFCVIAAAVALAAFGLVSLAHADDYEEGLPDYTPGLSVVGDDLSLTADNGVSTAPRADRALRAAKTTLDEGRTWNVGGVRHWQECLKMAGYTGSNTDASLPILDFTGKKLNLNSRGRKKGKNSSSCEQAGKVKMQTVEALPYKPNPSTDRKLVYLWGFGGKAVGGHRYGQSGALNQNSLPGADNSALFKHPDVFHNCNTRICPGSSRAVDSGQVIKLKPRTIEPNLYHLDSTGALVWENFSNYGTQGKYSPKGTDLGGVDHTPIMWNWINKKGGGIVRAHVTEGTDFHVANVKRLTSSAYTKTKCTTALKSGRTIHTGAPHTTGKKRWVKVLTPDGRWVVLKGKGLTRCLARKQVNGTGQSVNGDIEVAYGWAHNGKTQVYGWVVVRHRVGTGEWLDHFTTGALPRMAVNPRIAASVPGDDAGSDIEYEDEYDESFDDEYDDEELTDLESPGTPGWGVPTYGGALWRSGAGNNAATPMMTGDVNGDHKADAVYMYTTGANAGNWYTAWSTGGAFTAPGLTMTGHGTNSSRQFLKDVNGDQKADAIIYFGPSSPYAGRWFVALSNGSGFGPYWIEWATGLGADAYNVAVADVNGDDLADFVSYKWDGTWAVATSHPTGTDAPATWGSFGPATQSQLLGDVNGDGMADAVTFHHSTPEEADWKVALSNGEGFEPQDEPWISDFGSTTEGQMTRQVLADINVDGADDLVLVYLDTGTWHVAMSSQTSFDYDGQYWANGIASAFSAGTVSIADTTGDNTPDAVAASIATGNWTVGVATDFYPPDTKFLEGPGGEASTKIIGSKSATFTFEAPNDYSATFECSMDGTPFQACPSGKTYTNLTNATHTLYVRARDAAGNVDDTPDIRRFTVDSVPPDTTMTPGQNPASAAGLNQLKAVGRLNSDLKTDAVYLTADNHVKVGLAGDTEISGANGFDVEIPASPLALAVADMDGDHLDDLALSYSDGRAYVAKSLGNSFGTLVQWGSDLAVNNRHRLFGDVNNDDLADLVILDPETGVAQVAASTGSGYAALAPLMTTTAINSESQSLADVSGDGNLDLVYALNGDWYVARQLESGFAAPVLWRANFGRGTDGHAAADVTGDGKADAIAYFPETASWYVAKSTGTGFTGAAGEDELWAVGIGAGALLKQLGDADGDGRADIFSYFTGNGGETQLALSTGISFDASSASSFAERRAFTANSSDPIARFECRVDNPGGTFSACSSLFTTAELSEGIHTVEIRAVDEVNNADPTPARRVITVQRRIKINFQPASAPAFAGYTTDDGSGFGTKPDGRTFGWKSASGATTVATVDRDAANAQDQRYDSFATFGAPENKWEISVPNGTYSVRAVAGDPSEFNSVFRIAADGKAVINGTPTTDQRWVEGTADVNVTDGALTLSSLPGAVNNKISFVEVRPSADTTAPETTITSGAADNSTISSIAAAWEFSSDEANVVIRCQLDGGKWEICQSPYASPALSPGKHTILIAATDPSGNADETPARRNVTVARDASTRINFQPGGPTKYSGYFVDAGEWYGTHGNGLNYGWSTMNYTAPIPIERTTGTAPDARYKTFVQLEPSPGLLGLSWSIAVPNGNYRVRLVAGDPAENTGYFKFDVQGKRVIDGAPTAANKWLDGTVDVQVTDKRLSVTQPTGAAGNKLDFLEITPLAEDTIAPIVSVAIAGGNPSTVNQSAAAFDLSVNERATLTCKLDNGAAVPCGSDSLTTQCSKLEGFVGLPFESFICYPQKVYNGLSTGSHTVLVTATDMSGNVATASKTFTVSAVSPIRFNFQPAAAPNFPGWIPDSGETYTGTVRNGYVYGWRSNRATNQTVPFANDRNHASAPDQRYDTYLDLGGTDDLQRDLYWSIVLPNGAYDVRIAAGDPMNLNSVYRLDAEGKRVIDGVPNASNAWVEGTVRVQLLDGVLDITQPEGARNNKPNFIEIIPVTDTIAPELTILSPAQNAVLGSNDVPVTFRTNEPASFTCSIDAGAYTTCRSPKTFANLSSGAHSVSIRATDSAGNMSTSTRAFSVFGISPIKVDFQPAAAPRVSGYLVDSGLLYATRASGLTYGWGSSGLFGPSTLPVAYDRDAANSPDQRYDTFLSIGNETNGASTDLNWQMAVPAGNYRVKVVMGDANSFTGTYKLDVNGKRVIDGTPTTTNRWLENTVDVTSQGSILLTQPYGSLWNKIAFVEITPLDGDTVAPMVNISSPYTGASVYQPETIVEFSASEQATITCKLDSGAAVPCGADQLSQYCRNSTGGLAGTEWMTIQIDDYCTPTKLYRNLTTGSHTVVITATDPAGNVGSATTTFTVVPRNPLRVNFQPANAPTYLGYVVDSGANFSYTPVGGFTFGWMSSASPPTVPYANDRNHASSPDQRYDTYLDLGGADDLQRDLSWGVNLPKGVYDVTIAAGDPVNLNSVYKLDVEGVPVVNGAPTVANPWVVGTQRISVTDGMLNMTQPVGAFNNKPNFIDIIPVNQAIPPTVTMTSPREGQVNETGSIGMSFTANTVASLSCKLDAGAFVPCKSKHVFENVPVGPHSVTVQAVDVDGTIATDTKNVTVAEPTTKRIDFQPAASVVAEDYLADSGQIYADRGNGATYGWTTEVTGAVERNLVGDQRIDTFVPMGQAWELEVPYGTYQVHLVAGDVGDANSYSKIDAEGIRIIDTAHSAASLTAEGTKTVTVTDGRLSIARVAGSVNAKLDYIEVTPMVDTQAPAIYLGGVPDGGALNHSTATVEVMVNEPSTLTCRIDAAVATDCGEGKAGFLTGVEYRKTYRNLSIGSHTATVTATDTAGNVATATRSFSVGGAYDLKFQFLPSNRNPKTGYAADNGEPYAERANGMKYGWWSYTTGNQVSATRNAAISPDERYDSFVTMDDANNASSGQWNLEVPNGTYEVRVVAGDPTDTTGVNNIDVEYLPIVRGSGRTLSPWKDATRTVSVHDGTITLTTAAGAAKAKLNFVHIRAVDDQLAPDVTINSPEAWSHLAQTTLDARFTSSEPASFRCKLDTGAFSTCDTTSVEPSFFGAASVTYRNLATGNHRFEVEATDASGNVSVTGSTFFVNMPPVRVNFQPAGLPRYEGYVTDSGQAIANREDGLTYGWSSFDGSPAPATVDRNSRYSKDERYDTAVLLGGADGTNTSLQWEIALPTGTYRVRAVEGDPAGGPARYRLNAEDVELVNGDPDASDYWVEGTAVVEVSDGYLTISQGAGSFNNRLNFIDIQPIELDDTAPETSAQRTSGGSSPNAQITFSSSEPGSAFQCKLDDELFSSCSSPKSYSSMATGRHLLQVRAIDVAGNVDQTPARINVLVDEQAPTLQVTSPSAGVSNTASPPVQFSAQDAYGIQSVACAVDGAAATTCLTGDPLGPLSDGVHSLVVTATDVAGNTATVSRSFTIDIAAPQTTITAGPAEGSVIASNTPSLSFSSTESGVFECSLDAAAFSSCSSPLTTAALANGLHTFSVRAIDTVGNVDATPAMRSFVVDATAPTAPTNVAVGSIAATTANVTWTAGTDNHAIDRHTVYVNGVYRDFQPAGTNSYSLTGLTCGTGYSVRVDARDLAGNTTASAVTSFSTTACGSAPVVTISAPTAGQLIAATSTNVTFTATNTPTSTTCSIDGGAATACSSPASFTSLAQGSHTVTVAATNASGTGTAAVTFTVDSVLPDTTIASGPANASTITANTATYGFSSTESGTFECKVDSGSYAVCTTPFTTATLTNATHTFYVRAKDAAGNYDATPASRTVTVNNNGYWLYEGTTNMTSAAVVLPNYGTYDWVHWGRSVASDVNRKSPTVSPGIGGTYSLLGSGGTVSRITAPSTAMGWTSGAPTATESATYGGLSIGGATNRGFRVSIPVTSANNRMVYVVFGALNTQAKITASISDGSVATVSDTPITNSSTTTSTVGAAGFHVRSTSANATLSFDIQQNTSSATGSVQLYAATVANE